MGMMITRDALARMYPRAPAAWLDKFVEIGPGLCEFYNVGRLRWVHFAGQMAEETDGLTLSPMQESMNYRLDQMLKVFDYRLGRAIDKKWIIFGKVWTSKAALAKALVGHPETLADVVYGDREGTPYMQGHLYIGRGPTQVTHLDGYRAVGSEIGRQPGGASIDLVANAQLLATDPELGIRAAFADFQRNNLWHWADQDDCDTLSDALNTGNVKDKVKPLGLDRRRRETARAKGIWPADAPLVASSPAKAAAKRAIAATETAPAAPSGLRLGDSGDEVKRLQARLSELGFQVGAQDGTFGTLTKRALVAFQAEHELQPDGVAGPRTLEVMAQTAPADLGDRSKITAKDLAAAGSQTVAVTQSAKSWLVKAKAGLGLEFVDQYFNLGIADNVISKGEQVSSLMSRGKALKESATAAAPEALLAAAPTAGIHGLIMAGCAGGLVLGLVLWFTFHSIEQTRVKDARAGNNLAR